MLCLSVEFEGWKVVTAYGGSKVVDILEEVLDLALKVLDMIAQPLKLAISPSVQMRIMTV